MRLNNNFSKYLAKFEKPINLWMGVFIFTLLSGLFVQLVFLPYIAPSIHAGNGLIKGVDGSKFHRWAVEAATNIKLNGWGAWELKASNQLVSGVASFFYALIYPKPWSVLPFNAVLNATSAVCFFKIFYEISNDKSKSLIATFPFVFFPSALLWNTQFHNENYAIPGIIFILYGWVMLSKSKKYKIINKIFSLIIILIGSLLLGLVRIYIFSGMFFLCIILGIVLSIKWLISSGFSNKNLSHFVFIVFGLLIMSATNNIIDKKNKYSIINDVVVQNEIIIDEKVGEDLLNDEIVTDENIFDGSVADDEKKKLIYWGSPWIPDIIDQQLKKIATERNSLVRAWRDGGSSIDIEIVFYNANDIFSYIPRALQIGLFSPFPNIWYSEGNKPAGSIMRIISSVETMFSYLCFIGFPFFVWKNKKKTEIWVVLFLCLSMLIVYAMTVPNQGALVRFRYPFFLPIVSLGLLGLVEIKRKYINKRI